MGVIMHEYSFIDDTEHMKLKEDLGSSVGCLSLFSFVFSLFVMLNFNYYLDKCGVLNKIIEPAIFIFKINTNIISNTWM